MRPQQDRQEGQGRCPSRSPLRPVPFPPIVIWGGLLEACGVGLCSLSRGLGCDAAPQGGFGILEEMCVNYVHYYPLTPLELCKSAVQPSSLQAYFRTLSR